MKRNKARCSVMSCLDWEANPEEGLLDWEGDRLLRGYDKIPEQGILVAIGV